MRPRTVISDIGDIFETTDGASKSDAGIAAAKSTVTGAAGGAVIWGLASVKMMSRSV
jgi:hypothetical protein